jgi:hypothetical protein
VLKLTGLVHAGFSSVSIIGATASKRLTKTVDWDTL